MRKSIARQGGGQLDSEGVVGPETILRRKEVWPTKMRAHWRGDLSREYLVPVQLIEALYSAIVLPSVGLLSGMSRFITKSWNGTSAAMDLRRLP